MTHEEIKLWYERTIGAILPVEKALRDLVLDGFETHEDYVKYGDAFLPIAVTYTSVERQLNARDASSHPSQGS